MRVWLTAGVFISVFFVFLFLVEFGSVLNCKETPRDSKSVKYTTATVTVTVTATATNQPKASVRESNYTARSRSLPKDKSDFENWNTNIRCIELPDFSGICQYENICFASPHSIIFTNQSQNIGDVTRYEMDSYQLESRYRLPKQFPPQKAFAVPYSDVHLDTDLKNFHPNTIPVKDITFIEGTVWFVKGQTQWKNPYYFMKDTSQLRDIQWWNTTANLNLFSMDKIYLLQNEIEDGWGGDMFSFYLQPQTQIKNLWELEEATEKSPHCFERAVVVGDKPQYWSGMAASRDFRDRLYDYLDIPSETALERRKIPRPVNFIPTVFMNDRRLTRSFENLREMLTMITQHYRLKVSVTADFHPGTPLQYQANFFRSADVYIAAHGAGEVNFMFLPKGASVIEIFPSGMKNMLFERHAKNLGLHYFPVRSWIKPENITKAWTVYTEFYNTLCQNESGFQNNDNMCVHAAKNVAVHTPMREFEEALVNAFLVQGINIARRVKTQKRYIDDANYVENDPYRPQNFRILGKEKGYSWVHPCILNNQCYQLTEQE